MTGVPQPSLCPIKVNLTACCVLEAKQVLDEFSYRVVSALSTFGPGCFDGWQKNARISSGLQVRRLPAHPAFASPIGKPKHDFIV